MTKSDFIESMRKETGLSATKSVQIVELFFDEMSNVLATGNRVEIRVSPASMSRNIRGTPSETPRPEK